MIQQNELVKLERIRVGGRGNRPGIIIQHAPDVAQAKGVVQVLSPPASPALLSLFNPPFSLVFPFFSVALLSLNPPESKSARADNWRGADRDVSGWAPGN